MRVFIGLVNGMLAGATPILLAALGGTFTYYAGIFNIAMEGMILTAALFAVLGSFFSGSWLIGILLGILGALIMSFIFILFAVYLRSDEFVTGIALNLFALGATTYMMRQIFGVRGAFADPRIIPVPDLTIPILRNLPLFGEIFSGHNLLVYVAAGATVYAAWLVFRSRFGLRLRAAGYNADSLESSGVSTVRVRVWSLIICAVGCGLAGSFLSLGYVTLFSENMSAGRGWISLAAVILVKGNPWGIALISLLFGFTDGLGLLLQRVLPAQFTSMVPYVATLVALYVYSVSTRRSMGERSHL